MQVDHSLNSKISEYNQYLHFSHVKFMYTIYCFLVVFAKSNNRLKKDFKFFKMKLILQVLFFTESVVLKLALDLYFTTNFDLNQGKILEFRQI